MGWVRSKDSLGRPREAPRLAARDAPPQLSSPPKKSLRPPLLSASSAFLRVFDAWPLEPRGGAGSGWRGLRVEPPKRGASRTGACLRSRGRSRRRRRGPASASRRGVSRGSSRPSAHRRDRGEPVPVRRSRATLRPSAPIRFEALAHTCERALSRACASGPVMRPSRRRTIAPLMGAAPSSFRVSGAAASCRRQVLLAAVANRFGNAMYVVMFGMPVVR